MLRFNANLFRLAFGCASNEETRYYLAGVYVEPHAQGGVTLTATDGHRLVCIRDETGHADESAIIKLGDALKQCKAKAGSSRFVEIKTGENEATITEERDGMSGSLKIAMAYDVRIDGTFPDYRRVVPDRFSDKGAPGFNGHYVASFGELAVELAVHVGHKRRDSKMDNLRVLCAAGDNPEGSPALVLFPAFDFAFGILMPVRLVGADMGTPSWFRARAEVLQAAE